MCPELVNINSSNKTDRFQVLDCLRAMGLFFIIFAHSNPPQLLSALRSFDVILMVFVSGITLSLHPEQVACWRAYILKRMVRLLLPVWLFLTFFFLVEYLIVKMFGGEYPFSIKMIVDSYFLGHGIGYVWIIKVFLLAAVSAPLLVNLSMHIRSDLLYISVAFVVCWVYLQIQRDDYPRAIFVKDFLGYLVPYSCVFAVGLKIRFLSQIKTAILWLMLAVWLVLSLTLRCFEFANINQCKYPPQLYYLLYGVVMSILSYRLVSYVNLSGKFKIFIEFVSKASLWIYLWHIFFLYVWQLFSPMWAEKFYVKFVLVTGLSLFIVKMQIEIVTKMLDHVGWKGKRYQFVKLALL